MRPTGKDARAVDYTRLTALLIEATKQQQAEIVSALKQIKQQQRQIRQQTANIATLKSQVRNANESLRKVSQQPRNRSTHLLPNWQASQADETG